ncbi:MAG: helix-turn-helix domain-containing protein [Solirubrobacteraceae bacterium]
MPRTKLTAAETLRGKALAGLLSGARERRAKTQQALADEANVALDTLRAIEAGRSASPAFFTVAALALALDVRLDDLARDSQEGAK